MTTLNRLRKTEIAYQKHMKKTKHENIYCIFCDVVVKSDDQIVKKYTHFYVAKNNFPYAFWDGCRVIEHLLLIPANHIESLSKFNAAEKSDYLKLCAQYEKDGYDIFTRGFNSKTKSVPHQHTHFIKTQNTPINGMLYLNKPITQIVFD